MTPAQHQIVRAMNFCRKQTYHTISEDHKHKHYLAVTSYGFHKHYLGAMLGLGNFFKYQTKQALVVWEGSVITKIGMTHIISK